MSKFAINNQTPSVLSPEYNKYIKLKDPGDPEGLLTANLTNKLFTNSNTQITYKNKNLTPQDITDLFISCLGERINPHSEDLAKQLLSQTTINYQKSSQLLFKELYAQIAAAKANLPLPNIHAAYTINTDVIPSCKNYLAGQGNFDTVFTSFAFTFRPNVLGVAFNNENDFNNFKSLLLAYSQNHNLPSNTVSRINDFAKEKLNKLTDNLLLRANDNDDQEPYSFSRVLITLLFADPNAHLMPFDAGELYNPTKLILINLDKHAHSSVAEIKQNWKDIKNSSSQRFAMITNKKLLHLPSASRIQNRIKMHAAFNTQSSTARVAIKPLANTRPSNKILAKQIIKLLSHLGRVNQSSNTYKIKKRTFNKPNRRHPDDFNLAGQVTQTAYRPDLHIYLDTSGSISENNYEAGIKMCIALAKKLNIDIYFNSFSHVLSDCYKLPLKGRSVKQIYAIFQAIPKVSGGTEFNNVWYYINHSKKRRRELSLMITDFGYYPPNEHFNHPNNLFYVPIDTDTATFQYIKDDANAFLSAMQQSGHPIRKNILF